MSSLSSGNATAAAGGEGGHHQSGSTSSSGVNSKQGSSSNIINTSKNISSNNKNNSGSGSMEIDQDDESQVSQKQQQQQQQPSSQNHPKHPPHPARISQPTLHLTSDEVNYLIYRYMQESGFVHSAFSFVYESMLGRSNMRHAEKSIPPGALVSFLQKGLQYVGIEETLQREQQQEQQGSVASKRNKAVVGTSGGQSSATASTTNNPTVQTPDFLNLSLLSPTTIGALTRENPPLQLNVPPATAAAAVRARLEAEAIIEADRKKAAILELQESARANGGTAVAAATMAAGDPVGSSRMSGPSSIPPQPNILLTNPLVEAAMEAHAAQAAAAMSQLHQQHQNHSQQQLPPPAQHNPQHPRPAPAETSAGAAALMAQQRRAVQAEYSLLEEQRQAQLVQHQLQLQQQLRQEQEQIQMHEQQMHMQKLRQDTIAQAQAHVAAVAHHHQQQQQQQEGLMDHTVAGVNTMQAAAALALVAEQTGSNNGDSSGGGTGSSIGNMSGSKRPLSAKKGPKNKGKASKQQRTMAAAQQAQGTASAQQQAESTEAAVSSLSAMALAAAAQQNSGLSSLEEAVARLEAANGSTAAAVAAATSGIPPTSSSQDVAMSDGTGSGAEDNELRQIQQRQLHSSLVNKLSGSHPDLAAQHVQDLLMMNGNHRGPAAPSGDIQYNGGGGEPQDAQLPNGPISAAAVLAAAAEQHHLRESFQPVMRAGGGPPPKEVAKAADAIIDKEDELTNANDSEVLELKMHQSEVFMCAWNSVFTDMMATGSGDASARIWQMGGPKASDGLGPVRLLPHGAGPRDRKNKDVTTLEWSSDGKLLATGSYDGVARVWGLNGALVHVLRGHKGPIFSLKWNKKGNFLLSGSYDKTTIVWDVSGSNGFVEQQFSDHQAPALDVDWKDDTTFASCSTDKTVHICRVGITRPLKTYTGHTDEVNAVKWDPSGTLLASCSDDCTAKVWDVNSDRKDPLHDFKSHQEEIYTVKWAPTGPGSKNPEKLPMLATASFDGSVRLWNVQDGSCIQVFSRHRDSVYSVAFSPSGNYLASGSLAGQLYIWNVMEGRHVKSFKGKGDIFEVAWNKEETRVAACFSSNVVCIIDFP